VYVCVCVLRLYIIEYVGLNCIQFDHNNRLRNYELEFIGPGATSIPKEDYTTMVVSPANSYCCVKYRRRVKASK
jgi:hypothetical protein